MGIKVSPGLTPSQPESDVPFDILKNDNDTFTVKYTPPIAGIVEYAEINWKVFCSIDFISGEYTIMVMFAEEEIPTSPIKVSVASNHNAKKVKVQGPGVEKDGEHKLKIWAE